MKAQEFTLVDAEAVWRDTREHVLVPWSVQAKLQPLVITDARGCWMWDGKGRKILDFSSQLVNANVGHQHPKVVAAIKEQAEKMCFVAPPFASEARATLARMIAEVTPGDLKKSFFTCGGAEANENAIKLARHYTGKDKIITRYRSYHGATQGAMTLGGDNRRWFNEPGIHGVVRVFDPYCYRCPFGKEPSWCKLECVSHIEEVIWNEGPDYIAAMMIEGVTGSNGIIVPPDGYLPALRALCDRYGILLISDEVMSGFGRTGAWFAVDNWGVVPDMITMSKGLNCGYVPLGAAVISARMSDYFEDHMFWGGLTYGGHPLACAASIATIRVYQEEGLIENSRRMGQRLLRELERIKERHPSVGDVRGIGLFCGVELVKDKETKEPLVRWNGKDPGPMPRLLGAALEKGVYIMSRFNVLFLAPPLIIKEDELLFGTSVLDEVLEIADQG